MKVILRERKRHTTRRVASTRCAALSNPDLVPGGGVPGPKFRGGTPCQVLGGTPSQVKGRGKGTPSQVQGVPHPDLVWGGTPGTPLPRPGMGYPPYRDLR